VRRGEAINKSCALDGEPELADVRQAPEVRA
jgi:hypothetical protein